VDSGETRNMLADGTADSCWIPTNSYSTMQRSTTCILSNLLLKDEAYFVLYNGSLSFLSEFEECIRDDVVEYCLHEN
jgi:hypothetical protein